MNIVNGKESAYDLSDTEINIAPKYIKGHITQDKSTGYRTFVGKMDTETKVLRVDNLDHPEFYLEVDLTPFFKEMKKRKREEEGTSADDASLMVAMAYAKKVAERLNES